MKQFAPDYYKNFKCIASQCRHNCCIGWEIDIDEDTYEYYKTIKGALGERLSESISEEECPHFILGENERCPFLNKENLCDIICSLGEEALCNICSDHPRFRNFYSGFCEIGVGLSCEAAAKLIVENTEKTEICALSDDKEPCELTSEETEFFALRQGIFDILQNRDISIAERLCNVSDLCNTAYNMTDTGLAELYTDLEYMEESWKDIINALSKKNPDALLPENFDISFEQIAVYFFYRHLAKVLDGEPLSGVVFFCISAVKMIMQMCRYHIEKSGQLTHIDIAEYARMYSAEIEYSEENTYRICDSY